MLLKSLQVVLEQLARAANAQHLVARRGRAASAAATNKTAAQRAAIATRDAGRAGRRCRGGGAGAIS